MFLRQFNFVSVVQVGAVNITDVIVATIRIIAPVYGFIIVAVARIDANNVVSIFRFVNTCIGSELGVFQTGSFTKTAVYFGIGE